MKILHVDSSASGVTSVSRQLTAALTQATLDADTTASVVYRDLAASPIGHFGADTMRALRPRAGESGALSDSARQEAVLAETVLAEFIEADIVVLGAPMYNFGVSSQLKAWIDRLAQSGRTFRYTASGPEGLAAGKRLVIVSSRGGKYAGEAFESAMDHQEAYLRTVFGFFGITDVTTVRAEGVDMGPQARAQAIGQALAQIPELARRLGRARVNSREEPAVADA